MTPCHNCVRIIARYLQSLEIFNLHQHKKVMHTRPFPGSYRNKSVNRGKVEVAPCWVKTSWRTAWKAEKLVSEGKKTRVWEIDVGLLCLEVVYFPYVSQLVMWYVGVNIIENCQTNVTVISTVNLCEINLQSTRDLVNTCMYNPGFVNTLCSKCGGPAVAAVSGKRVYCCCMLQQLNVYLITVVTIIELYG